MKGIRFSPPVMVLAFGCVLLAINMARALRGRSEAGDKKVIAAFVVPEDQAG